MMFNASITEPKRMMRATPCDYDQGAIRGQRECSAHRTEQESLDGPVSARSHDEQGRRLRMPQQD